MTGGALIGGYATGPADADADDRHPGGRHRRRLIARVELGNALARRPGERRRRAGPGLLRARRHRADHHRRQPGARAGSAPTASSAARCGSTSTAGRSGRSTDKIAKPLGLDPIEAAEGILRIATTKMAHVVRWVTTERGLDAADFALVAYGGAGPLHAAAVARELGHRQGGDPARAGALLGLRHAGRGPAPRLRQHLVHAARRRAVRTAWKRCSPTWRRAGRETVTRGQVGAAHERDARRRHALRRPGARRHGRPAARAVQAARTATASSGASMRSTRRATASRCRAGEGRDRQPARRHRSGRCASRRSSRSPRAARTRQPRASAARARSISPATGFVETPTYDRAALKAGNRIDRPGADRGACLDHRRAPGRPPDGRRVRRPHHRDRQELTWTPSTKRRARTDAPRPGGHRDRAQRPRRHHRGDEDQLDAHRLQHDHLRGARLHRRPVRRQGQHGVDRPRPADVHPRHERHREGQAQALRRRTDSSRATSCSPTTPTSPARTSTT